jgi:hypothetical protein
MDSDEQLRRLLTWQADQPSAYSGFQMMLDHQQQGEEMALPPWNRDRWSDWTKESGRFTRTRLPAPASLLRALPGQFKVKPDAAELASYGADLDRLPAPFGETLPDPAAIPED